MPLPEAVPLPEPVTVVLRATDDGGGQAMPLLSSDPDGWPRAALISSAECVVTDSDHLVLGLHAGSRTTRNLRDRPIAVLLIVAGDVHRVRLRVDAVGDATEVDGVALVPVHCTVVDVEVDTVAYAEIVSAITFHTDDPAVPVRWRRQRDWLAGLAGG